MASPFRWFDNSPGVIRTVIMMYVWFPLSLRQVENLPAERGIDICHEAVRLWWNRFGPMFTDEIRRKRVQAMRQFTHWRWHLDEAFVRNNGERHYFWRAIDDEGDILESFTTKPRDKTAVLKFLKKIMRRYGRLKAIVTDGLRSYRAAQKEIGGARKQETGRWLNNRVENSNLPFRRQERAMQHLRQMKTLQKFIAVHAAFHNHFNLERHLISRGKYKTQRSASLAE